MSKIDYCPRGGMKGILTTKAEQLALSNAMNEDYIDTYIPLPGMTAEKQAEKISYNKCDKNHDTMEDATYWENEDGAHGWCCSECGEVLQWG